MKCILQFEIRHGKRKTIDGLYQICLSDMDNNSDGCEQEDPALPVETSLMDAHECFKTQEEASCKIPQIKSVVN